MFLFLLWPASSALAVGEEAQALERASSAFVHIQLQLHTISFDSDRVACGEQSMVRFLTSYYWLPCMGLFDATISKISFCSRE